MTPPLIKSHISQDILNEINKILKKTNDLPLGIDEVMLPNKQ